VDGVHDLTGVAGVLVQAAEDQQVRDGQAAAASLTAHHRQDFDREVNAFDVEDADRVEQDRPAGIELTPALELSVPLVQACWNARQDVRDHRRH